MLASQARVRSGQLVSTLHVTQRHTQDGRQHDKRPQVGLRQAARPTAAVRQQHAAPRHVLRDRLNFLGMPRCSQGHPRTYMLGMGEVKFRQASKPAD